MISSKRAVSVRDNALLSMAALSFAVTANELAVEVMKLEGIKISSVPKRFPEMKRYGHISLIEHRACRVSGENAGAYRITASGLEHLRSKGLYSGGAVAVVVPSVDYPKQVAIKPVQEKPATVQRSTVGRSALSGLKTALN